ncbi:glycoside hydrolase family 2 protein [Oscillochloris sp. ZM17-4]|uniref:beta-mannosidase n=1 Tax=Oscillochloris sp. ZM17-4 TaxID=2866714 RepID=UPI001C73215D|nr:glycoside hydrolase family 2 protein [Oscillochloris sp. ZM17-4]MBX0330738.1 glycoside hydrolase family 2 protein [Oscillochloris sp. ZM17-4]
MHQITLTAGWQLKRRDAGRALAADLGDGDGWLPATVPGGVFAALLAAGRIPDPFFGTNELDVQWVGEADWLFRCAFALSDEDLAAGPGALCLDGLDTFATVILNGRQVHSGDNMFAPARVDVSGLLRAGENELGILFESAMRRGKLIEAERGRLHLWNGDASRLYVRKAQYHYGWDWGPTLMDAGPWRPVRLELGAARIAELRCPAEVADDLEAADLPVTVSLEGAEGLRVRLALISPGGALADEASVDVSDGAASHSFRLEEPQLWWPNGYGAQPLYRLEATLLREGEPLDRRELRLGLRRLRLVQEPLEDAPGTSFCFEVNGTPIFGGGANWIPADSLINRIAPERYRAWVDLAAKANMVMLRVWGGGVYEDEAFYQACDERGILVWQDFMFACGMYPAHPEFQASVRAEAQAQVKRLRHHACLALWCGNNEDYAIAESVGKYDARVTSNLAASAFPARAIYEELLPEVCAQLDPARPYWPGSPYGGSSSADQTVGDRHSWDVWHGQMAPYQHYPRYTARFVSEFGMQAAPHMRTVEEFAPPEERRPGSRSFEFHNKAFDVGKGIADGPRRLAVYISDTVGATGEMEGYIYASQLMQAEALAAAYAGFRRGWGGPGRAHCGGALVWQINDCWPVTSWAIVDWRLRPKPAYFILRRQLAPLSLNMAHTEGGAQIWAVNGGLGAVAAELELTAYALGGARRELGRRSVELGPNRATELGGLPAVGPGEVIGARLLRGGETLARAALWPEPLKYLELRDPELRVERLGDDRLRVSADRPAKGVWLDAGDGVEWSDNMLDLLPGDPQELTAAGLGGAALTAICLRTA